MLDRKALFRTFDSTLAHLEPLKRVIEQLDNRSGKRIQIARRDQKPGLAVLDNFRQCALIKSDHRFAAGHRLNVYDPERFRITGMDKHIHCSQRRPYIIELSSKGRVVADAKFFGESFHLLEICVPQMKWITTDK